MRLHGKNTRQRIKEFGRLSAEAIGAAHQGKSKRLMELQEEMADLFNGLSDMHKEVEAELAKYGLRVGPIVERCILYYDRTK